MLQAIIFDMDGVIVDTEYLEFSLQKQFIEYLSTHHHPITLEQQSEVAGKSLNDIPAIVKKLSGSSLPLAEIRRRYEKFFYELFDNVDFLSIFRADIREILCYAKQNGIKLAVASSSQKAHIDNILTACGIHDEFDLIVSGEWFAESKPNPDIYRYTMEKLGVQPAYSVAVEDSFYGMQAAKRAGMRVIGYEEKRMLIDQSLADFMGKNMTEIFTVIKELHENEA